MGNTLFWDREAYGRDRFETTAAPVLQTAEIAQSYALRQM